MEVVHENKQDPPASLPMPRPNLVWEMEGFLSVVLFVYLFVCLVWLPWIPSMEVERMRGSMSMQGTQGLPLRGRGTCRETTEQSRSANTHRHSDPARKDRSRSLIFLWMLFRTYIKHIFKVDVWSSNLIRHNLL
ncbi:unnamed protein product [Arctogadus glacialis]